MGNPHNDPTQNTGDILKSLQHPNATKPPVIELKTDVLLQKLGVSQNTYQALIEPRLSARALNKDAFNSAFAQFTDLLISTGTTENFIRILQSVAAKGIAETHLRRNKAFALYHDAPHAAEVASNVNDLLTQYYNNTDINNPITPIVIALAQSAAACHDIIQNQSNPEEPMANEEKSAVHFAKYLKESILKKLQPELEKSMPDNNRQNTQQIITLFVNLLPFMSNELIVPTTYLVKPSNKPLAYYINQLEPPTPPNTVKQAMNYLDEAALAISFCDTNRNLLLNTIHNKNELKELAALSQTHPESLTSMNNMFDYLHANTEEQKESFLLALGASLRMFPELNTFRTGENKINNTELALFSGKLEEARTAAMTTLNYDGYAKYLNMFLNTIEMSISFANSIDSKTFTQIAERSHASTLLQNIDPNGWKTHADYLPPLKKYWNTLNAAQKEALAGTLFNLAARQEGVKLVQANTEVQQLLFHAAKPITTATERNRFFATSPEPTANTQPTPPTLSTNITRKQ